MLDADQITTELADLLSRRSHDLHLALGTTGATDAEISAAARRLVGDLLAGDELAAAAVIGLAWPDTEPDLSWWSTRLGAATTLASAAPSVSITRAAGMVGVSRQRIYHLLAELGPLERHADGGIDMASLRDFIARRQAS